VRLDSFSITAFNVLPDPVRTPVTLMFISFVVKLLFIDEDDEPEPTSEATLVVAL
jgi:hypothetical protein